MEKKQKVLYEALADAAALAQAKALYEEGLSGMETEFSRYMEAEAVLEQSGIPREWLWQRRPQFMSSWRRSTPISVLQEKSWRCARKSRTACLRWSGRSIKLNPEKRKAMRSTGDGRIAPCRLFSGIESLDRPKLTQAHRPPRVGRHDKKKEAMPIKKLNRSLTAQVFGSGMVIP